MIYTEKMESSITRIVPQLEIDSTISYYICFNNSARARIAIESQITDKLYKFFPNNYVPFFTLYEAHAFCAFRIFFYTCEFIQKLPIYVI